MFLCIGGGLLLTLGYDLLELFCAFIPGEIHIYSCGDVDLREPLEISVKAISSSSDKYAVTRSLPFAIYADSVSPLLLHKRGKKVFYSVRISAEKRQVVIVHKFLTFFWGFTGPSVYEIVFLKRSFSFRKFLFHHNIKKQIIFLTSGKNALL